MFWGGGALLEIKVPLYCTYVMIFCHICEINGTCTHTIFFLDDLHGVKGPREGNSCDNETIHLEFTALISTCSSNGFQLEQYDSRYDCRAIDMHICIYPHCTCINH